MNKKEKLYMDFFLRFLYCEGHFLFFHFKTGLVFLLLELLHYYMALEQILGWQQGCNGEMNGACPSSLILSFLIFDP